MLDLLSGGRLVEDFGANVAWWAIGDRVSQFGTAAARPDLDDPATLGCLLALVRKTLGDAEAYLVPGEKVGWDLHTWYWNGTGERTFRGHTEAVALVVALESAP